MLIEKGIDIFGIPSVITSDQGPQFVSRPTSKHCVPVWEFDKPIAKPDAPREMGVRKPLGRCSITFFAKYTRPIK